MPIIVKYLITAAVVVLVSEIAKRSDQMGTLIASLPLVTFMVLIWLHLEHQPSVKIRHQPVVRLLNKARHGRYARTRG